MLAEILSKMETLPLKEVSQGDTLPGPGYQNRDAALQDTEVGPVLPVPTSARSSGNPWPPPRMLFCPISRKRARTRASRCPGRTVAPGFFGG